MVQYFRDISRGVSLARWEGTISGRPGPLPIATGYMIRIYTHGYEPPICEGTDGRSGKDGKSCKPGKDGKEGKKGDNGIDGKKGKVDRVKRRDKGGHICADIIKSHCAMFEA